MPCFSQSRFRPLLSAALFALVSPGNAQVAHSSFQGRNAKIPSVLAAQALNSTQPLPTRQLLVKFRSGSEMPPAEFARRVSRVFPMKSLLPGDFRKRGGQAGKSSSLPSTLIFQRSIEQIGWHVFEVPSPEFVGTIRDAVRLMPEVAEVILDQKLRLLSPPANPQWGKPADEYNFAQILTSLGLNFTPSRDYDSGGWNYSWHLETVNALAAWENYPASYPTAAQRTPLPASRKPLVAVLDTGIDLTHPGFKGAGGSSTDAGAGGQIQTNLARNFYNGSTSTDPNEAMDVFGHGTSVAGVIAAAPNNGVGIPGLGFPARIVPVRVYGADGDGQDSDLIRAITYAADSGCVLVNISARTDLGYSRAGQDAIDYAWAHNTLVIAAMGNDGSKTDANAGLIRRYPAGYNKVLSVGATTYSGPDFTFNNHFYTGSLEDETLAYYSNYGQNAGVVAPAGQDTLFANNAPNQGDEFWDAVITGLGYPSGTVPEYVFTYTTAPTYLVPLSDPNNAAFGGYAQQGNYGLNYGSIPGTSFACPLVTGLAALYCAKFNITQATPNAPQRILQAIQRGADNLQGRTDGGFSYIYGWGRINALATLTEQNKRNATVGGVVGIVLNGSTVVGANEVYLDSTAPGSLSATTTSDGVFHLINVRPGAHLLITSVNGTTVTANVTVTPGCDLSGVELKKAPAAVQVSPQNLVISYGRTQPFTVTVTGLPNNQVVWSLPLHNGGRISSTGVLTAPAMPGASSQEIVQATSLADPTAISTSLVTYVPLLTSFSVAATNVSGGSGTTGTIRLNFSPIDPVQVDLRSTNSVVDFPSSVTIPPGSNFVTFPITVPTTLQNAVTTLVASLAGVSKQVTLNVSPGFAANVSGIVTLQAAANKAQNVTFLFRPTDGSPTVTASQTLERDGSYTIPNLPRKRFNVWIKGDRWLAKVVPADTTNGNAAGINVSLLAGDANNNNSIDVDDLTLLLNVYNSADGDGAYDAACDFNTDGKVNVDDLTLLLDNYNTRGAN